MKEIGIDAGMAFTRGKGNASSTHCVVEIIIEHMILTCPDSSDGRGADMLHVGCGFKTRSELKF